MNIPAFHLALLSLLYTTLGTPSFAAQPPASVAGHWEGFITLPGTELGIKVDLALANDTWEGTIDIPLQGLRGLALSELVIKDNIVSFKMPDIPGNPAFTATIEPEKNKMSGSFTQAAQTFPFDLVRAIAAPRKEPRRQEGSWHWFRRGLARLSPTKSPRIQSYRQRTERHDGQSRSERAKHPHHESQL